MAVLVDQSLVFKISLKLFKKKCFKYFLLNKLVFFFANLSSFSDIKLNLFIEPTNDDALDNLIEGFNIIEIIIHITRMCLSHKVIFVIKIIYIIRPNQIT